MTKERKKNIKNHETHVSTFSNKELCVCSKTQMDPRTGRHNVDYVTVAHHLPDVINPLNNKYDVVRPF